MNTLLATIRTRNVINISLLKTEKGNYAKNIIYQVCYYRKL